MNPRMNAAIIPHPAPDPLPRLRLACPERKSKVKPRPRRKSVSKIRRQLGHPAPPAGLASVLVPGDDYGWFGGSLRPTTTEVRSVSRMRLRMIECAAAQDTSTLHVEAAIFGLSPNSDEFVRMLHLFSWDCRKQGEPDLSALIIRTDGCPSERWRSASGRSWEECVMDAHRFWRKRFP